MRSRKLPSLNALRAFEAAARHLSFTRAAEELHVTQAAISHQVRTLEEQLDLMFFRRANRGILLTDAGQELLPTVTDALDLLAAGCRRVSKRDETGALVISTTDSFAVCWLVPRLHLFRKVHPDVDVRIGTGDALADLVRDDVDLAIRYGSGDYPGLDVELLMRDEVFPVCSLDYQKGSGLKSPRDLRNHPLIRGDTAHDLWKRWLKAAGLEDMPVLWSLEADHFHLMYQAARGGQGVAIASAVAVADDLETGRLVRPFDLAVPSEGSYFIVGARGRLRKPKVRRFVDWLKNVAREERRVGRAPPITEE